MSLALGASTYSYLYDYTLDDSLQRIADLGFRYVELLTMPPHLWAPDPRGRARSALRARMESLGLEAIAVGPMYFDLNLASTNPAVRAASVHEVVHNLRLASDLGARVVTTIAGRRNALFPAPLDLTWDLCRQSLLECLDTAAHVGVAIGLEPIMYSFISTGADARRMIEGIGSSWLRGLIDTANAHATEGVEAAVQAVGPYLAHVQISDTVKGQLRHDPVGDGEIDFWAAIAALRAVGYDGPCILELCHAADPDGGLRVSVQRLGEIGLVQ
ncbi:MAG: sugar phosphate isomerase/epimerase [Chloroflexi bacterium]|nr:sugar phosphate isomerase/epimerase [Chloroflexota bacterium]